MAKDVTQISIKVPDSLTPEQQDELGRLIIDHIHDRTDRGLDKNGKKFPKYSKSYIDSLDFENAGKSASSINLKLSGDMMAAIEVIKQRPGEIRIGIVDEDVKPRAEGNILGSYGGDPDKSKARDFLGIQKNKLKELINYVKDEIDG